MADVTREQALEAALREAAKQLRIIAGMDLIGASAVAYNAARAAEAAIAMPPAQGVDWANAEIMRQRDILSYIRIYCDDMLSGRIEGLDDKELLRSAILECRNRARAAIAPTPDDTPPAQGVDVVMTPEQFVADILHDDMLHGFLSQRICCDGHECGCRGADVGSYLEWRARESTPPAPAPAQGVEFTRGGEAAIEAAANACRRVGWPKAYERHPENYGREALARHLAAEECANTILALLPPAPEASHE